MPTAPMQYQAASIVSLEQPHVLNALKARVTTHQKRLVKYSLAQQTAEYIIKSHVHHAKLAIH